MSCILEVHPELYGSRISGGDLYSLKDIKKGRRRLQRYKVLCISCASFSKILRQVLWRAFAAAGKEMDFASTKGAFGKAFCRTFPSTRRMSDVCFPVHSSKLSLECFTAWPTFAARQLLVCVRAF